MLLPVVFVVVFLVTRWPGLMPPNFSAIYGFAFCAGVFWSGRVAFAVPLGAMLLSDLFLNIVVYQVSPLHLMTVLNWVAIAGIVAFSRFFFRKDSWLKLVGGGVVGALLFYLFTNTAAWFFNPFRNPEYTKTLSGWLIALTKGTGGYPETWMFFRNTLFSGGLFTALFAGAAKLTEAPPEPSEEKEEESANQPSGEAEAST
jgi:hypothetical protein